MAHNADTPSWDLMLPEMLGRCFNLLDDEERCQVIPLVSKAFRRSHLGHPPQPVDLCTSKPLTPSRVRWFIKISRRVEYLMVEVPRHGPCLLLELLQSAELPDLQRVELWGAWSRRVAVPPLLRTLSKLRELSLREWNITADKSFQGFHIVSSLTSLVELDLGWIWYDSSACDRFGRQQTASLWTALGNLRDLRVLKIDPKDRSGCTYDDLYGEDSGCFRGLSALTQIRHLCITRFGICLEPGLQFQAVHTSFWSLTQLQSLRMKGSGRSSNFRPVLALTQLRVLWLEAFLQEYRSRRNAPPLDLSPLCRLTSLRLDAWTDSPVSTYLPPTMPALPNLGHLALRRMRMEEFPPSLASTLRSLTYLDLHGNNFKRLPQPVKTLTRLALLDLSGNQRLQLVEEDEVFLFGLEGLNVDGCPLAYYDMYGGDESIVKDLGMQFKGLSNIGDTAEYAWFV